MSFVFWCYQTYKTGKYSICPKGKLFEAYTRHILGLEEQQTLNGSQYTILQLEVLYK